MWRRQARKKISPTALGKGGTAQSDLAQVQTKNKQARRGRFQGGSREHNEDI